MNYRLFCKPLASILISTLRSQTVDEALYNSCVQLVESDVSDCFIGTFGKLSGTCKTWTVVKTVTSADTLSATITGLKSKTSTSFKVNAYLTKGTKTYVGKSAATVTAKTK